VHERGGLIYLDGANMNAISASRRPGDFGADMMHYNPHKTFSGPHGGGGPGAGRSACREARPVSARAIVVVERDGRYASTTIAEVDRPRAQLLRQRRRAGAGYCYIRTHGPDGLRAVSKRRAQRQLPAGRVKHFLLPVPHGDRCMHEFVASPRALKKQKGASRAMDIAKRLLDYGFHAPTVYFPLTVPEAMMIEPTETESKETLDAFAEEAQTSIS
jgi:glycine dehydrogenase subunit 2